MMGKKSFFLPSKLFTVGTVGRNGIIPIPLRLFRERSDPWRGLNGRMKGLKAPLLSEEEAVGAAK
jgi:hypothetical protein